MKIVLTAAILASTMIYHVSSFADVVTDTISNQRVRMMFTGQEIDQFRVIENAIRDSRSQAQTRCFNREIQDDFGAPSLERVCSVIFPSSMAEIVSSNGYVQITESALVREIRSQLRNQRNKVIKVNVEGFRTVTSCSANTGGICSTGRVRALVGKFNFVGKLNGKKQGSFFCVNPKYSRRGLTNASGCYIVGSKSNKVGAFSLKEEALSCSEKFKVDIHVMRRILPCTVDANSMDRDYAILSGDSFRTQIVTEQRDDLGNRLPIDDKRSPDSSALFDIEFDRLDISGLRYREGDIICKLNQFSENSLVYAIECINRSNTDRQFCGSRPTDVAEAIVKGCNYDSSLI